MKTIAITTSTARIVITIERPAQPAPQLVPVAATPAVQVPIAVVPIVDRIADYLNATYKGLATRATNETHLSIWTSNGFYRVGNVGGIWAMTAYDRESDHRAGKASDMTAIFGTYPSTLAYSHTANSSGIPLRFDNLADYETVAKAIAHQVLDYGN